MKPSKTIYTLLLIGISFLIPIASFSQITSYKFEQLDSLQKAEKRNVAVFIHTNWCKYCHTMQNTTLKNDSIIEQLNKKFYFINLNAEQKKDIVFNGHTFKYKPTGINTGIHELAEQLATISFLNTNNEIIFQYNQFINSTNLDIILKRLK
jgi:thioredoxin-related protein